MESHSTRTEVAQVGWEDIPYDQLLGGLVVNEDRRVIIARDHLWRIGMGMRTGPLEVKPGRIVQATPTIRIGMGATPDTNPYESSPSSIDIFLCTAINPTNLQKTSDDEFLVGRDHFGRGFQFELKRGDSEGLGRKYESQAYLSPNIPDDQAMLSLDNDGNILIENHDPVVGVSVFGFNS